jgi:hypothetical protein
MMREFSSYGPIDTDLHYSVPRTALIEQTLAHLKGKVPNKGGHYITIWGPRQTGKTWIMQEVFFKLQKDSQFEVVILSVQFLDSVTEVNQVAQLIAQELTEKLHLEPLNIKTASDFHRLFKREVLRKPLILILDEFDALSEEAINRLVSIFRHIYNTRRGQWDKITAEKDYLLHGLALIGVRAVLGVENLKGSPFNVQRSVRIPNLTHEEVIDLFNQYQHESGQSIEPEVVERIWYEFQGQPGLTNWFGELLTETYNQAPEQPLTMANFEGVYVAALDLLPNNNILNLISKAKQEPYQPIVLEMFQTNAKFQFTYDDPTVNFLYMNGIISVEKVNLSKNYVKFQSPYIQKRLFNYFARELYRDMDRLYDPFDDLADTLTDNNLNMPRLLQRYEHYLQANRQQVLKDAPRRKDLRVYEAVFQFHLYRYLVSFFANYEAQVHPEFPTGNGQIDLLIRYAGQLFGLELKSFANQHSYQQALKQAATYGQQLGVTEIWLVLFIESIDENNRKRFEIDYVDSKTGIIVHPQFVQTGKE